jgi:hypothetical protein
MEQQRRCSLEMKINPIFDPLRTDPRFEKLVNQIIPPASK